MRTKKHIKVIQEEIKISASAGLGEKSKLETDEHPKVFIYVDNYRGFSDTYIPLEQVNFFVGENSTGKSSILELLERFFYPPFWFFEPKFSVPGALNRHFLDLVSADSRNKSQFTVGAAEIKTGDHRQYGMIITYKNSDGRPVPAKISVIHNDEIRTIYGDFWFGSEEITYKHRVSKISDNQNCTNDDCRDMRCAVAVHLSNKGFKTKSLKDAPYAPLFMRHASDFFDNEERKKQIPELFVSKFIDLAPIRTKPKRTYDAPQTEFSPEGEHTPYELGKYLGAKSQIAKEFKAYLEQAGKESGLFNSIGIKYFGNNPESPFEMQVKIGNTPLRLDCVGYGVSQALPVLVEIFVRGIETAFSIQQPEVHLHPRAQANFGDLIAEISRKENKIFFIETHSDFTIDRFRLNIRKNGAIESQLLFFERKQGGNSITPIKISRSGDLPHNQPDAYREFFFNESLALLS
jgi:hypothetical protein